MTDPCHLAAPLVRRAARHTVHGIGRRAALHPKALAAVVVAAACGAGVVGMASKLSIGGTHPAPPAPLPGLADRKSGEHGALARLASGAGLSSSPADGRRVATGNLVTGNVQSLAPEAIAVPEPASLAMLGGCLLGLVGLRWWHA